MGQGLAVHQARAYFGQISLLHRWIEAIEVLRDEEIQNGIAEEFQSFVGFDLRTKVLQIGTMQEGFKEKVPVLWVMPKELFKPGEVKLLLAERRAQGVDIQTVARDTASTREKPGIQFSECVEHSRLQPIQHHTPLRLIFSEQQGGVVTTKPERVADRHVDRAFPGNIGNVVQVTVGIGGLVVDCRMDFVFTHGHDGRD